MHKMMNAPPEPQTHARPWWRGFSARIVFAVATLALALILVTSAVSYDALRTTTLEVASQNLEGRANTLRHDLETRVHHLSSNLQELSRNPLFATALTDDMGRKVYLRDFLQGVTSSEGLRISLVMTDFRGRAIAYNIPNADFAPPSDWVSKVVETSQGAGRLIYTEDGPHLMLAEPIIFSHTGLAEGALVLWVNLANWLRSESVSSIFTEAPWLSSLYLEHQNIINHRPGMAIGRGKVDPDGPKIRQLVKLPEFIKGDAIAIHMSAKASFIQGPLNDLLLRITVVSVAVFLAALMGSMFLARTLTRKLARLRNEAAQVSEAKFHDIKFTDEGRDEIDELAQAFTVLIDELQNAYRQLEDESQREIEARERHYQGIVNNSAEGIITISETGLIETFNPSAERIFGYAANEVIGENVSILMPRQERAAHDMYLKHSHLHAPKIINRSRDLTGQRKDGNTFPLELNVSPMEIGGQKKFIGIIRDISERKEFEGRINAARVEAEQANMAKSQFLSSMSHELRTPLNAILGFGQLLEMDDSDKFGSSQKEAVRQILKGGKHLLELIDQVLNLAKIESGSMTISIEPIDMSVLLNDSWAMAKTMAKERSIKVHANIPETDEPVFVNADRTKLQQILLNLLSNAIKYNVPEGSVTLSYEVRQDDGMCRVSVSDNGPGIPEHLHGNVFAPFNRLGAEGSDIEGTGIGLTITRELVHMMRGEIGFTSATGEGTTFWFDLPLTEPSARPGVSKEILLSASATQRQNNDKHTVLYVEDNPSNLQLMEMLFGQRSDLELITAATAERGLAIARAAPPDLVLMDINLPGMSGIEALRALRQNGSTAGIPVIAISANAMPREIDEAMKEGFAAYLTKPLNLQNTLEAIEKALK